MAGSSGGEKSKEFLQRLAQLKRQSFEVKFDLEGSDYTAVENIGIGAYGVVCSAVHKKTNDRVAIKKIHKAFEFEKIATRTYREIKILKHFKHDNIISIRDILKPKGSVNEFNDIYIVLDLMESDLHRIIYSKQELSEEHVRYFLYQLLRGLKYIHSAKVIHRDLKPSNLLVNEDCQLRIGDFGMARGFSSNPDEPNHFMTQYVATRWYRAPEIMLSMVEYSSAVDMWSVGCIFAEMLGRKHLFPGKDYIQQIKYIIGVLGSPSKAVMDLCNSDIIKSFVNQLGNKEGIAWTTLYPKASRKAINLLSRMLVLHPGERITVEEALKHHYLSKYHDPDDEPVCVPAFNFDFENQQLNMDQLRQMTYKEIMEYHQPKCFDAFLRPAPKEPLKSEASVKNEQVVPEVNKVKVEVGQLASQTSNDVEMPSAKVEDTSQEVIVQTELQRNKDAVKPEVKGQENQTVSDNTKELIKAALKNANLRKQRQESLNEEQNKNKPITAAQRQREREEKRKKKMERSLERMKKKKEKKGEKKPDSLLTSADKEMLERWAKMQKNVQQIAPKPAQSELPQGSEQTITIINIHQQVITIPNQGDNSNQQQLAGDGQSKPLTQIFSLQAGQRGSLPTQTGLSQKEKVIGQPERRESDSCVYKMLREENKQNLLAGATNQTVKQITGVGQKSETVPGFSTINMQDLHSLGIANAALNETEMYSQLSNSSEKVHNSSSSSENLDNTSSNFTNRRSPYSQGSPLKDYSNNGSPESYTSQGSPDNFLDTSDNSEPGQSNLNAANPTSNFKNVPQNYQNTGSSNFQCNLQSGTGFVQSTKTNESVETTSVSGVRGDNPSMPGNIPSNFSNSGIVNQPQVQNRPDNYAYQQMVQKFSEQTNKPELHNQNFSYESLGETPSFFSSSYEESFLDKQNFKSGDSFQSYENQHNHQNKLSRRSSSNQEYLNFPSCQYSSAGQGQFTGQGNQDINNVQQGTSFSNVGNEQRNQGNFPSEQNFHQNFSLSQPDFHNQTGVPFQTYASSQVPGVSQPSLAAQGLSHQHYPIQHQLPASSLQHQQSASFQQLQPQMRQNQPIGHNQSKQPALQINTKTQPDLISVLTKQLSRSQVDDPGPPALVLTPKGTGAGYGLGMDLDSLIMDSQDAELGRTAAEPSPLSSSLLNDWMEVTGDLHIDMDALAQELNLQSPMALSYSDLSMYPS